MPYVSPCFSTNPLSEVRDLPFLGHSLQRSSYGPLAPSTGGWGLFNSLSQVEFTLPCRKQPSAILTTLTWRERQPVLRTLHPSPEQVSISAPSLLIYLKGVRIFLVRNNGSLLRASDAGKICSSVAFQPRCEITEQNHCGLVHPLLSWYTLPVAMWACMPTWQMGTQRHSREGAPRRPARRKQSRAEKEGTSASIGVSPRRGAGTVSLSSGIPVFHW